MDDDFVEIAEVSTFDGGQVANCVAFDVKTMFEGVEVAGLAATETLFGLLRRFGGGEKFIERDVF